MTFCIYSNITIKCKLLEASNGNIFIQIQLIKNKVQCECVSRVIGFWKLNAMINVTDEVQHIQSDTDWLAEGLNLL